MPTGCRLPAWGAAGGGSYLPEYANPGSKAAAERPYLLEYAKPGSKAAAAERSGSGIAACVRTALGEHGELRR